MTATRTRLSAPGHALTTEWNGEYGVESMSTGTCKCGQWSETTSSAHETRFEFQCHIATVLGFNRPDQARAALAARQAVRP